MNFCVFSCVTSYFGYLSGKNPPYSWLLSPLYFCSWNKTLKTQRIWGRLSLRTRLYQMQFSLYIRTHVFEMLMKVESCCESWLLHLDVTSLDRGKKKKKKKVNKLPVFPVATLYNNIQHGQCGSITTAQSKKVVCWEEKKKRKKKHRRLDVSTAAACLKRGERKLRSDKLITNLKKPATTLNHINAPTEINVVSPTIL